MFSCGRLRARSAGTEHRIYWHTPMIGGSLWDRVEAILSSEELLRGRRIKITRSGRIRIICATRVGPTPTPSAQPHDWHKKTGSPSSNLCPDADGRTCDTRRLTIRTSSPNLDMAMCQTVLSEMRCCGIYHCAVEPAWSLWLLPKSCEPPSILLHF
jgi:hypothetical protein